MIPAAFDYVVLHPIPNPPTPDDPERGYTARVARDRVREPEAGVVQRPLVTCIGVAETGDDCETCIHTTRLMDRSSDR